MQGEHPQQVFLRVDDVDVVHGLGGFRHFAQCGDRLIGPQGGRDRDERRGHQTTGGLGWIGEELAQLLRFLRLHLDEDDVAVFAFQLAEDVGRVVGIELFEHVRGV